MADRRQIYLYNLRRMVAVLIGIALNIGLSFLTDRLGLVLYLDTIGTVAVASVMGLFPGMITAFFSNIIMGFNGGYSAFYAVISIIIAIISAAMFREGKIKRVRDLITFVILAALAGGGLGSMIELALLGHPESGPIADSARIIDPSEGPFFILSFIGITILVDLIDKSITVAVVALLLKLIPDREKQKIWISVWRQRPLTDEELKAYRSRREEREISLQGRLSMVIIVAMVSVAAGMGVVSLQLFISNLKGEYTDSAVKAAEFAAGVIDPDMVDEYLSSGSTLRGYSDESYRETMRLLDAYCDSVEHLTYIYVYQIHPEGCYIIFDTDDEVQATSSIGDIENFDSSFEPYIDSLLAGEEMEPFENDDKYGFFITAYKPLYDSKGQCVAYVGADASMDYLNTYISEFILRVLLIFSGFFIIILAYGLWMARVYMAYPVDSMAVCADNLADSGTDQEAMDRYVRELNSLDIRTGDEVEKLYRALCRMARNNADQMRGIRYFADANSKMQNGLIITMADMVENRDSDTGAHIQKTAAYVRIILDGLKKKGYYAEKLTDKYMSDVEMSAPLHDVGKINIPDAVLNKPGKLTDEEYEIMKTHTTAGKNILENAISTVQGENYLKEARNMAAYHHERWDGRGYPEGLHGQVIPLSARIMAVADVFDALTSPRVYKPAFPLEKALEMIQEGAGTQFDPKCVEVFMDSLTEVKKVLTKYQES